MRASRTIAGALIGAVMLPACALHMIDRITKPEDLTPAQIKAFSDMGMTVYACFQISGLPVGGNASIILWPSNESFPHRFGHNCSILPTDPR